MKAKIFLLAVISAFLFNSCSSSDDSSASIVGLWKFNREGGIVNGEEVLTAYEHNQPECGKDSTEFKADGSLIDTYYSPECEPVPHVGSYTKQGNTLTVTLSSGPTIFTILKLTSTILKVKNGDGYIIELIK